MKRDKMKRVMGIFLIAATFLISCGRTDNLGTEEKQGPDTLILAVFNESAELRSQVMAFNESNELYQIEIQRYERSLQPEDDGLLRLQREIATGNGPDIIDFGSDYTTSDIVGEYTEDLFPYLETENIEDYFLNVIQSFSYGDKLYAVPLSFKLETFAGSRKVLGDLEHWNIREMMECFQQQDQNVMLYPGQTKRDVFGTILTGSMECYIDWEKGTCDFNGQEFRDVMAFCNTFPESLDITNEFSVKQTFLDGKALLLNIRLSQIYDICKAEHIFDEEDITYIGFPVEGVCGTVIKPGGPVLAISRNSEHKDAAWQFIYQCLEKQYQSEMASGLPVCRSALEEKLAQGCIVEYSQDGEGKEKPIVKQQILFEGEDPIDIYSITEDQADKLVKLIESAEVNTSVDYQLYLILLEEADSYFNGDKSLEEVADIIQSRASVYISEKTG